MRRSQIFTALVAPAILFIVSGIASAQVAQMRGHVLLKQADGTTVPAAGAQIDIYRSDIAGKYDTKADKKGQFVFAGLPIVGTYVIAASAPNAQPAAIPGAKAGREIDFEVVLNPGDGKRFTEAEAKANAGGVKQFTGRDSSFETPAAEDDVLIIDTEAETAEASLVRLHGVVSPLIHFQS